MEREAQAVLDFWFGDAVSSPTAAATRATFWFSTPPETDARIRERFLASIEAAARGDFAASAREPRPALALVTLLDQFPRNVWRGSAQAFAHDPQALATARAVVAARWLPALAPIEQAFLILPFEHSEAIEDQRECVRLSGEITAAAPDEWKPALRLFAKSAHQHLALIERFGRFPHRNRVLGRTPTAEEIAFLGEGGATFGQG